MGTRILNIAGGKIKPIELYVDVPYFLVNIDRSYYSEITCSMCESYYETWRSKKENFFNNIYLNTDIQEFLERTIMKFDYVTIYRYLEHVSMRDILYFIYLISTVTEKDSVIEVIVPDYEALAKMLIQESIHDDNYEANNIIITTEMLNEPQDPHASVWTVARMRHYWELEGRFKTKDIEHSYEFDGRNIYIRALLERI